VLRPADIHQNSIAGKNYGLSQCLTSYQRRPLLCGSENRLEIDGIPRATAFEWSICAWVTQGCSGNAGYCGDG
jgi:hypothetical protein